MSRRKKKFRAPVAKVQPILIAAEQRVESQLAPDVRESYMKIVVAGMKAGLADGANSMLAGLDKSKDPISDCAKGAIGVVVMLKHQAKGIMPIKAMVPAGMTLMLKALEFADRTGIVKVGPSELDRAAQIFAEAFLGKYNITPQMMKNAIVNAHKITQDPVAMEHMKRTVSAEQKSGAPAPTPVGNF